MPQGGITYLSLLGIHNFYTKSGVGINILYGSRSCDIESANAVLLEDHQVLESCEEGEQAFHVHIGPEAVFGVQVRALGVRVFGEAHVGFIYDTSLDQGIMTSALVGMSLFDSYTPSS